jgi:hypothetical protein
MAGPFKMKGFSGFGNSSPMRQETDPETVDVPSGSFGIEPTTFENPYLAYQMKNIPKKSTRGAPVAGGKIFSNVSGLQVSGPGVEDSRRFGMTGRERTDEMMRGEGNVYMMEKLRSEDKDESGLPDVFESGSSKEVRDLGKDKKSKKELTKAEKIKAYQKSQLTL